MNSVQSVYSCLFVFLHTTSKGRINSLIFYAWFSSPMFIFTLCWISLMFKLMLKVCAHTREQGRLAETRWVASQLCH